MLVTQQPVLRRFWYPVMPLDHLTQGPQSFTLLGQPLVLWLTDNGTPAALTTAGPLTLMEHVSKFPS